MSRLLPFAGVNSLFDFDLDLFRQQILILRKYTKNMSVLVVEDYLVLQKSLEKIFLPLFNQVDVASDGVEALELYKQKKSQNRSYDIVFSDIVMPNMNGVELTKEIKNIEKTQPIIIFSAHQDSQYLLELINLEVRRFILKPISLKELLEEVQLTCKNIYDEKNLSNIVKLHESVTYHLKERELYIGNESIGLSLQERLILELFLSRVNQTFSNQEIVNYLYENGLDVDFENIRKMVYKLRKKLSNDLIENIHSIGYRIKKQSDINTPL